MVETVSARPSGVLDRIERAASELTLKAYEKVFGGRLGHATRQLEDGSEVIIDIFSYGSNVLPGFPSDIFSFPDFGPPGVFIVMTQDFPHYPEQIQQDTFYSLDEERNQYWYHIQKSPFFGDVEETYDNSLARLVPYKDDALRALGRHFGARRILQRGFESFQRTT